MKEEEFLAIKKGTKIQDSRTGELLEYDYFDGIYAVCIDSRGVCLWLVPERIEIL
jgi:hypothetical protein